MIASSVLASQGAKNLDIASFNPFLDQSAEKSGKPPRSQRLTWLDPATAEGIIQAREQGIFPLAYWVALAPMWNNIVETAKFHRGD